MIKLFYDKEVANLEILTDFYNNNFIACYLICAILVLIFIFIVISSMKSTPKKNEDYEEEKILDDPINSDISQNDFFIQEKKELDIEPSKIDIMVEELYQQKITEAPKEEDQLNLNEFLEEFDVPEKVIEEVVEENNIEIENVNFKNEQTKSEDIENMLKRLYDLRQNESTIRKTVLLNEIYDLKKQVDEKLKSNNSNYTLNDNIDTKALADYYLFNEDIEFPKLK